MISFVIPVFSSAKSLPELYQRLVSSFQPITSNKFEIIFVEDCGNDNSWDLIREIVRNDFRVRGYRLNRNYGQHNALLCGIREAIGDVIVTLDDDLQHPPEEIHKLLEKFNAGYDVVYGPPEQERHGVIRDLLSRITKLALESSMGAANARQVSALRVFKANLRDAFADYRSPMVNVDVLLTWATSNFSAVRVKHEMRKFGKSGYSAGKLLRHTLNMMTGFSVRPLQIASVVGFSFSLLGLVILVYVGAIWILRGSVVPGFLFLASIISIFSGAQLLAIGILGEYLSRVHLRTLNQPAYFIREKI